MIIPLLILSLRAVSARAAESQYNWSSASRIVYPTGVFASTGKIVNDGPVYGLEEPTNTYSVFSGSALTYDFGQITSGFLTLSLGAVASNGSIKVSFSESSLFIGNVSDQSIFFPHDDGYIELNATSHSSLTLDAAYGRGAFRYITIQSTSKVQLSGASVYFSPMPDAKESELRAYTGYFDSSDDLYNRIWYGGAYTTQLCLISSNTSVDHNYLTKPFGCPNNASVVPLVPNDTFLADGAKRDRNPWAGDLSVAVDSVAVAHNRDNLASVRCSLQGMLILQNNVTGYLTYAGLPLGELYLSSVISDTYHFWTMFGFADYVLKSGDMEFGRVHAGQIVTGLEAARRQIGFSGLFNGTNSADWGRNYLLGGTSAANAILYATIHLLSDMAFAIQSPALNETYMESLPNTAERIKTSMNAQLFDSRVGLYYDNMTELGHKIYPQDGNALAVQYNLTSSIQQAQNTSKALSARLGLYGSPAPEFIGGIAPFSGSHELEAHLVANPANSTAARQLLVRQWGYMQSFSASTHIEGYGTDGSLTYPFYGTASFISHAHAWSTGPTSTLINTVLGLSASTITSGWSFFPHFLGSGLTYCSGGYFNNNATYDANWTLTASTFRAYLNVSSGSGIIKLPLNDTARVTINGQIAQPNASVDDVSLFSNISAGAITVIVQY